jgi:hypothetical protein
VPSVRKDKLRAVSYELRVAATTINYKLQTINKLGSIEHFRAILTQMDANEPKPANGTAHPKYFCIVKEREVRRSLGV